MDGAHDNPEGSPDRPSTGPGGDADPSGGDGDGGDATEGTTEHVIVVHSGADPADADSVVRALQTGSTRAITPRLVNLIEQPWPVHRARWARRWLVVALVVAPIVATISTWWGLSTQEQREVVGLDGIEAERHLEVDATTEVMDPTLGELTVRLVPRPRGDLVEADRLTEDVTLLVNDQSGPSIRTYEAGSVMDPLTVLIQMEGSPARYPFDDYLGQFRVGATVGDGDSAEPLLLDMSLTAALVDFSVNGSAEESANSVTVDLELQRRWDTIVWVILFMIICWAIAASCAGVVWWIVVFNAEPPFWVYALLASVLFALPVLRGGLPGSARYGSLVDWAAFYWAILIVATGLVLLLVTWNVTARAAFREAMRADRAGSRRTGDDPGQGSPR